MYQGLMRYEIINIYVDGKKLGSNRDGFVCIMYGKNPVPNIKFDFFVENPETLPKNPFTYFDVVTDLFLGDKHDLFEFKGFFTFLKYEYETGIIKAEIMSEGQFLLNGKPFGN